MNAHIQWFPNEYQQQYIPNYPQEYSVDPQDERVFGFGFGVPFLGGLAGGLLAGSLLSPWGYGGYGYPYGGVPYGYGAPYGYGGF